MQGSLGCNVHPPTQDSFRFLPKLGPSEEPYRVPETHEKVHVAFRPRFSPGYGTEYADIGHSVLVG